jgi:hypothetical protein
MRKTGLILAVLAAAAMPTVAEAAKKKRTAKPAAQVAQPVNPNEGSARLVRGAIPIFLPGWALPVYFSTPVGQADHPNQNPHLLNPQGTGTQAKSATTSRRTKR